MLDLTSRMAFAVGLFGILGFVAAFLWCHWQPRYQPIVRTSLALLLNWMAGVAYVELTQNYCPWQFNIVIDGLAAFVVMYRPASKPQGYIGLFYMAQIACHIAFGIRKLGIIGEPGESTVYYDTITWIAWAQLMALGVWCGGIWHNSLFCRVRFGHLEVIDKPRTAHTRKAE